MSKIKIRLKEEFNHEPHEHHEPVVRFIIIKIRNLSQFRYLGIKLKIASRNLKLKS